MKKVALVLALSGCGGALDQTPGPPSTGTCSGSHNAFIGGSDVLLDLSGPMNSNSEFHRLDGSLGNESASLRLAYVASATNFVISAELSDMPTDTHVGTYTAFDGFVTAWSVSEPSIPNVNEVELVIASASNKRIEGTFSMTDFAGNTVDCTYELRRDYRLDTDD